MSIFVERERAQNINIIYQQLILTPMGDSDGEFHAGGRCKGKPLWEVAFELQKVRE